MKEVLTHWSHYFFLLVSKINQTLFKSESEEKFSSDLNKELEPRERVVYKIPRLGR